MFEWTWQTVIGLIDYVCFCIQLTGLATQDVTLAHWHVQVAPHGCRNGKLQANDAFKNNTHLKKPASYEAAGNVICTPGRHDTLCITSLACTGSSWDRRATISDKT